ncbi:relaxase/mobilization nuclease domain-containing protein [Niabella sp.]|uniref:relaxase/mobilization nuclease domain-containing protein n=1 Tax=Niabella sp. TaxID=1962976 RepID=UPI002616107C|nr:relaxase/mobilization nuclease domain-containing protein [Niabella sp.]
MVARITSGKNIRGVLSYNENKVKEGAAICIDAVGFGCLPEELSFVGKLARFTGLTERNSIAKTNAIHISLNFHPDEKLENQTLRDIAETYMEKIGFGDQPYLVYRHNDAAHPHIHIATVNILSDGKRIDIHDVGRNESTKARREIEELFGLVRADEQKGNGDSGLKPADLSVAEYGKRPTKNEISNIVRTVAKYYRYTNFEEYRTILKEYNIQANRGEPGTRMHKSGGMVYQILDPKTGNVVGVPVKSSSIYEKPTLKNIESNYERNGEIRKKYRERAKQTIDGILEKHTDKKSFLEALKSENIIATFKRNDSGYIYGITYLDKTSCCFFNGSDLGKAYSAKAILERLQTGNAIENLQNRDFVGKLLSETDFSKDFKEVLSSWVGAGALIRAFDSGDGEIRYKMGTPKSTEDSWLPVNKKLVGYFRANQFGINQANTVLDFVLTRLFPSTLFQGKEYEWEHIFLKIERDLASVLQKLWDPVYTNQSMPIELIREARKKKKRRRH